MDFQKKTVPWLLIKYRKYIFLLLFLSLTLALFEHSLVICNNQQFTARRGEIASPEYPKKYPKNSRCDWTIAVDKGYQITLTFTQVICLWIGTAYQITVLLMLCHGSSLFKFFAIYKMISNRLNPTHFWRLFKGWNQVKMLGGEPSHSFVIPSPLYQVILYNRSKTL